MPLCMEAKKDLKINNIYYTSNNEYINEQINLKGNTQIAM